MSKKIALVTKQNPDSTPFLAEDTVLLPEYRHLLPDGIQIKDVAWEDKNIAWEAFDSIIIKSCWNYHLPNMLAPFQTWLQSLEGLNVWNPLPIIHWNLDKHYLLALADAGIPIVPSVFVEKGLSTDLHDILTLQGWTQAIAKPAIGADAYQILRIDSVDDAPKIQPQFDALLPQTGMIIQPLIREIQTTGEWSFLFMRDRSGEFGYRYAMQKLPAAGEIAVQTGSKSLAEPAPIWIQQAQNVIEACINLVGASLLYARVDGVIVNGQLLLMELEVIDPSFYVEIAPDETMPYFIGCLEASLNR